MPNDPNHQSLSDYTNLIDVNTGNQLVINADGSLPTNSSSYPQPVTGTFWPVTQPVSGTFWQATQPVSGTFWQATQPISGSVSLGVSTSKTVVMKTGTLVTTSATADQVILTYTVTSGKTLYLQYLRMSGVHTVIAGSVNKIIGKISFENPSGTKVIAQNLVSCTDTITDFVSLTFSEAIPVNSATVIRVLTTPADVASYTWDASFGGYEK